MASTSDRVARIKSIGPRLEREFKDYQGDANAYRIRLAILHEFYAIRRAERAPRAEAARRAAETKRIRKATALMLRVPESTVDVIRRPARNPR